MSDTGTPPVKPLEHYWQSVNGVALLLLPLSWLFSLLAWLRRLAYRHGLFETVRLPVPVIVVGNITVGGAGKTPLVIWLVEFCRALGLRPGVIARGYGAAPGQWPRRVDGASDPAGSGDEPLLIARRTGVPVWVDPDRPRAARALLAAQKCDILISDDGMQHYALGRDLEIAVSDAARGLGNGWRLPAGPLREAPSRLESVDLRVSNGPARPGEHTMRLAPLAIRSVREPARTRGWDSLTGTALHAVAGIGNPERFFAALRARGLEVIAHPLPDHHRFRAADIAFEDGLTVLMTEKDAVKCAAIAGERHWYVEVAAELDEAFRARLEQLIRGLNNG
ncbi:MAG: tetraacyldisaccharide 4'-kinase [Candidatus Sedimenticola endophacoides]|uniref:Tetraacyldisaccharide 4'-kinase n=2 Tax=Candidatus Sedimenticola endophacoides TaxID=2548426 RepID=A0A6N4E5A9_9GAMM|nr:MAG: tetraacyldisaccharide 4'-kinase [Candidatus Sedimenticola endophacoides]PUE01214.1 MAG: tetraacyldisaccharide 4'-kinase [Candidatus Sedimenticola endophacoides]PUE04957.1 MAG: tetraacyldisaccharide 4'-kinase [Candidatus Sedimenticola endophacoides]